MYVFKRPELIDRDTLARMRMPASHPYRPESEEWRAVPLDDLLDAVLAALRQGGYKPHAPAIARVRAKRGFMACIRLDGLPPALRWRTRLLDRMNKGGNPTSLWCAVRHSNDGFWSPTLLAGCTTGYADCVERGGITLDTYTAGRHHRSKPLPELAAAMVDTFTAGLADTVPWLRKAAERKLTAAQAAHAILRLHVQAGAFPVRFTPMVARRSYVLNRDSMTVLELAAAVGAACQGRSAVDQMETQGRTWVHLCDTELAVLSKLGD